MLPFATSQPVKLSDGLVLGARLAAELQERSIAGQVEYWAKLGQAIEHLLTGSQVQALRRAGGEESLAERIASVDTPTVRARLNAYLDSQPYPRFMAGGQPGLLLRIEEDLWLRGKTAGRLSFSGRRRGGCSLCYQNPD